MKIPSDAEAAKLSPDELRRAYIENLHILRSLALENDALKRTGTVCGRRFASSVSLFSWSTLYYYKKSILVCYLSRKAQKLGSLKLFVGFIFMHLSG